MIINSSSSNQTVIITNLEQKKQYVSTSQNRAQNQFIIKTVLNQILSSAKQILHENSLVRTSLNLFAMNFSQNYIKQAIKMQYDRKYKIEQQKQELQPNPLKSDNLIPVGTNLQTRPLQNLQNKQSKQEALSQSRIPRNSSIISQRSTIQKNSLPLDNISKKPKVYEFIKLKQEDLPKIQICTDPFVDQLRKQKQMKQSDRKEAKKSDKKSLRQIIKKDEKISYDFSGQIIKVKQPAQKGNFSQKIIQGNQNQLLTLKQKEIKVDSFPTNLENNVKKDLSKRNLSKRGPDVQFSNIGSLASQIQINQGVKFIHNKAIIQKKLKQPTINQLKKTIGNKRFSKGDFERLKSLGQNKSMRSKAQSPSLPTILKSETDVIDKNSSIFQRSLSQAKLQMKAGYSNYKNSVLHTERSQERISIENQQLTQMLLQNINNTFESMSKLRLPAEQIQINKNQTLSAMDKANLQFIKTGSVGRIQFPKISYRIQPSMIKNPNTLTILESKIKLKGKKKENQFQRLRKHFQDKLRI